MLKRRNSGDLKLAKLPRGSVARAYPRALFGAPQAVTDWEHSQVDWLDHNRFEKGELIGSGKFSQVFASIDTENRDRPIVVKVFKTGKDLKVKREIFILRYLENGPNIIEYYGCFQLPTPEKEACLVFGTVKETPWRELMDAINYQDIQHYMYQVLKALDYAHSKGVMHRDIKPQNFIADHGSRVIKVIDWGLSDFYIPGRDYNVYVASRFFKAPELLLHFKRYDHAIDMWAFGCTLAAIIFKKNFLFMGDDDLDQLSVITEQLGTQELVNYVNKYDMSFGGRMEISGFVFGGATNYRRNWDYHVNDSNRDWATLEALDLIDRLLRYDHHDRLTAQEAMYHPFFKDYTDPDAPKDTECEQVSSDPNETPCADEMPALQI
ncbi:kinase-like domain-containing protein [Polychytrium aggregatum]|uniref:kinase-like domain-containing protein n=1 Tax=Polychytrium aggregatum TaxID=110093 RepID=UPI0022FE6899|nr:kinase-like domain-containing protein [Polychytrium aggregatum]KAI9197495.1 kinase-like domain-containing protein [Polychytrium aggregatum]